VQILITNAQWYLQGWCHLRQAMRTFHLDRVSEARLTDIPITHAGDHVPEAFSTVPDEGEVTVRMPARFAPLLGSFLSADNVEESDGTITARLHMADPRGIKRIAARLGGVLEVLDPGVARTAAREWAAAGLALYHHPDGAAAG
jgi:proteasome accessory factor C